MDDEHMEPFIFIDNMWDNKQGIVEIYGDACQEAGMVQIHGPWQWERRWDPVN